jgi:PAS domain S-box-containing protein
MNVNKSVHHNRLPFLSGGGDMGELLRSIDWSATPLGPPAKWPPALKQTVSMMLTTIFPVLICWGKDYIQLYNDAFRPINGKTKHPQAFGGGAKDTYAEIWDTIAPMFASVMDGQTFGFPDFMVPLDRNGQPEECYFDFSYSPIRDEKGEIGGVLVICVETTAKVQALKEMATVNEEFAATNEELEAANEEMAVTNEELIETQRNLELIIAALAESESRLKMAIESTNLGTWDYNPVSGALYWSDECKKIYGLAPHQSIGFNDFSEHIYPEDRSRVLQNIQRAMYPQGDGRYNITYRVLRFDNNESRWIRAQGAVAFNSKGQAERFIGTVLDITESKLAQEKIDRSEKFFRSIALNIPNSVVIVIDKDHRYVLVEGDLMEKMGYDRRDYEGKHPTEIGQTERYNASKQLYDRMMAGEKFSVERKAATGESYIVHFVPLANEHGEVEAGLVMALDITDIKQAEEKGAKLGAIIESSDDAIISKTLESIITSWNDSAQRMFGYTADEIIGETIYKLIPADRQEEEPRILARLKRGERVEHFETKRMTKDGRLIDVSLTISPVKDSQGNIIGLSKIARDITEKKLEEQRKHDFIGMVSHELKTPLTSLNGIIQVANAKLKNSDDTFLASAMQKANIQVKRTAMINGFLNVSRLEAGKMPIEKDFFSLDQLLHEIFDETSLVVSTHAIKFTGTDPVQVNADRDKISSVVSNLMSNAIKYSPRGKMIEMGYHANQKTVIVSVKDGGMGIKPQDLGKIFDRYYRVENTDTRHISGFGIGLYLSAEIIEHHNGKIWAESEVGKGSTFYFELPLG